MEEKAFPINLNLTKKLYDLTNDPPHSPATPDTLHSG